MIGATPESAAWWLKGSARQLIVAGLVGSALLGIWTILPFPVNRLRDSFTATHPSIPVEEQPWRPDSSGGPPSGVTTAAEKQPPESAPLLQPVPLLRPVQLPCRHPGGGTREAPGYGVVELVGASSMQLVPRHAGNHVLVTGGAGYIGSHAVLRLLEEGYAVTTVDNLSRGHLHAIRTLQSFACDRDRRLAFARLDLGDKERVAALLLETRPDWVMHFAAVAFVAESIGQPLLYYRNVTENTLILLLAMERADVSNMIYSSSCTTYGVPEPGEMPITENVPQRPMNPYGRSKLMAEQMLLSWVSSKPSLCVTILRYFNVIGADPKGRLGEVPWLRGDQKDSRISSALFDAASGRIPRLRVYGNNFPTRDGTCERDYIHVVDLVDVHVLALRGRQPAAAGLRGAKQAVCGAEVYNIGLGAPSSVLDMARAARSLPGALPFEVEFYPRRAGDPPCLYADSSKLKAALGWKPRFTDLSGALATSWRFRHQNPELYSHLDRLPNSTARSLFPK